MLRDERERERDVSERETKRNETLLFLFFSMFARSKKVPSRKIGGRRFAPSFGSVIDSVTVILGCINSPDLFRLGCISMNLFLP